MPKPTKLRMILRNVNREQNDTEILREEFENSRIQEFDDSMIRQLLTQAKDL